MSIVIAAAALMLAFHGQGAPGTQTAPPAAFTPANSGASDPAALSAAREWVTLLDGQHWEESWRTAASLFKAKLSAGQWAGMVQPTRQPLGAVSSRTLLNATRAASLPGAPAGDYEVVQFRTDFAGKPDAVETVALAREGVSWKVAGYFIR